MSNEELATRIKAGETGLIPDLWEQTFRLMYLKAAEYYNSHREQCNAAGVEPDDLRQECFLALPDAAKAYDPGSGFLFTAYLNYPLLNHFNALAGLRTAKQLREAAAPAISLETPIGDGITVADTLPCPAAAAAFEQAEERIYNAELRGALDACLARLPERNREAIRLHYYEGLTCRSCGETLGISAQQAAQAVAGGLCGMCRGKCRRILEPFKTESLAYRHRGLRHFRSTFTSVTEYATMQLIEGGNRRQEQARSG